MKNVAYFLAFGVGIISGYLINTGDMTWYHYIALAVLIFMTMVAIYRVQYNRDETYDLHEDNKLLTEKVNDYVSHIKDLDREIKLLEQMVIDASNANTKTVNVDGGDLDDE